MEKQLKSQNNTGKWELLYACLAPVIIIAAFIWLLISSWQRWSDLLIDYGREVYVPWQITEGKKLYEDLAYFNGPLSPYFNALLFRIFGVSIMTLVYANLVIMIAITAMIYQMISKIANLYLATICCVTFLVVFAFAHQTIIGNYNFVCPYSHEATHGFFLGLLAVWLMQFTKLSTNWRTFLAGLAVGGTFLCKPEMFIAAAGATIGMWFVQWRLSVSSESVSDEPGLSEKKQSIRIAICSAICSAMWGIIGSVTAIVTVIAIVSYWLGIPESMNGSLVAWKGIFGTDVTQQRFYTMLQGTDRPLTHLADTAAALLAIGSVIVIGWQFQHREKRAWILVTAVAILVGTHYFRDKLAPFLLISKALLFLMIGLVIWLAMQFFRGKNKIVSKDELVVLTGLSLLGLLLLSKVFLNPRIYHYGFVLAIPSTLLVIVIAFTLVPRIAFPANTSKIGYFLVLGIFLFVDLNRYQLITSKMYDEQNVVITHHGETLIGLEDQLGGRDPIVQEFIQEAEELIGPDQTLACLPEGCTINYLLRRPNTTPYFNLMPIEMILFGESTITDAYKTNPPDFVLLIHKDVTEYGDYKFGDSVYGGDLLEWIKENYVTVKNYGAEPFVSKEFGMVLLKRR